MPRLSIDAERASRQIIKACTAGTSEIVLGAPAKLAATIEAIAPNVTTAILETINRYLLPDPAEKTVPQTGVEGESRISRSALPRLWKSRN